MSASAPLEHALQTGPTVRYAEWNVEESAIGRQSLWAGALGRWPWFAWPLLIAICTVASLVGWPSELGHAGTVALFAALTCLAVGTIFLVPFAKRIESETGDRMNRLRDPGPNVQVSVMLMLVRGHNSLLGFDSGLLSVVDGRLYYVGSKTSFGFSPQFARLVTGGPQLRRRQERMGMRFVEFERDGVTYALGLRPPLQSPNDPALEWLLNAWGAESEEPSSVEILPPTTPPPDTLRQSQRMSLNLFTFCSMVAVVVNSFFLGQWFEPDGSDSQVPLRALIASGLILAVIGCGLYAMNEQEKRRLKRLTDDQGLP